MAAGIKAEVDAFVAKITDKKEGQAALEGLGKVTSEKGSVAEPFLVGALGQILEAAGDKSKNVRDAAIAVAKAIVDVMSPFAVEAAMPALLSGLSVKAKPQQKEATLNIIISIAEKSPSSVGHVLVTLAMPVAELTCDIKKEVKEAATNCMTAICNCTGNKDLEPFLPFVVKAASSIDNTHACVERLAGCIFVQNVEAPALAAMLPVLSRGLNDKVEEVKRTCCLIVDNMCKVVEDPAAVIPILPRLEPLVKSACEKMANPEARTMAERALKSLQKAAEGAETKQVDVAEALKLIKTALGDKASGDAAFEVQAAHTAALAAMATNLRSFDSGVWAKQVGFLEPFADVIEDLRVKMEVASKPAEEIEEEDTEGVDLYKGSFSLAYGTLTLLRDTKMHLKRDRFYGLLGPNQCGKTTLMRAIANEQLEVSPSATS
jgi:elongation factor 3